MWIVLGLLIIGAFVALGEIITALEVIIPYVILLGLAVGLIVVLEDAVRSRIAKIAIALCVLSAAYAFGTPGGAVRTAVLFSGHPVEAVTLRVRKANEAEKALEGWQECGSTVLYRVSKNAPKATNEDHTRDVWTVSRHLLLFYSAHYYGETEAFLNIKALNELQRAQERRPVGVYRVYEDFTVHGIDVSEDTVVVLENLDSERTRIVIYGKDEFGNPLRHEDILLRSELPTPGPNEIVGPWYWNLPLSTPHLRHKNNSGVYITPELYAVLDSEWAKDPDLSYYEIEKLIHQINALNQK